MNINYFAIFKFALAVFVVLLLLQWLPDGVRSFGGIFPSRHHTGEYNRAAVVIIVIGLIGFVRILRQKGRPS